jgi:hypothetical protein
LASACLQGAASASAAPPPDEVAVTAEIPVADPPDVGTALDTLFSLESDVLIRLPQRLEKAALDFSVASPKEAGRWLRVIHTDQLFGSRRRRCR